MRISYTVTAIPKEKGKNKKYYRGVYDIGHYYARNTPDQHEVIRLLIGEAFGKTEREYIDLAKNDVLIHLDSNSEEQNNTKGSNSAETGERGKDEPV